LDLYPAIDIHAGRVVRASRTRLDGATLYADDPLAIADRFVAAGARWVHLVDLDRAFGVGNQSNLIAELVRRLPIPTQAGGGMDAPDAVAELRDLGVQRVLVGPRAIADDATREALAEQFSADSLGVAIDVDGDRVWARHWAGAGDWTPLALARLAAGAGITTIALTELSREGALAGSGWAAAAALAREARVEVIVSGGVDGLDDLARIRDAGLAGAIIGRALYEDRMSLEDALACCSSSSPS